MERGPRTTRILGIALSLGVLVALGIVLGRMMLRDPSPAGAPRAGDSMAPERGGASHVPAIGAPSAESPAPERAAIQVESPVGPAPSSAAADGSPTFQLEVLDDFTGDPVARAEVLLLDLGPAATPSEIEELSDLTRVDALLASGDPLERETDESGKVDLPRPRGRTLVVAREDGRFGHLDLSPSVSESARIRIAPDWSLSVQVVDQAGHGLPGVPINLRRCSGTNAIETIVARTEGPDGIGVLPHAGACIGRPRDEFVWAVGVAVALRARLQQEIDPLAPPTEPVRFELPETGSVVLEVWDADGLPFADAAHAWLHVESIPERGHDEPLRTREPVLQGRAHFPFVECGLELTAVTTRPSSRSAEIDARFTGPRIQGETVVVPLRFGAICPVLVGRIVNPGGEPIANRALYWMVRAGSFSALTNLGTGPDGRFRFDLPTEYAAREGLVLTLLDRSSGAAGNGVSIPASLPPGQHDLGDIVLGGAALVAAGVVVDSTGAPVPRAGIALSVRPRGGPLDPSTTRWDFSYPYHTRSDATGRFSLWGEVETAHPIQLRVTHEAFFRAQIECPLGAQDVRVELEQCGSIVGRAVADAGIPLELVVADLHPSAGTPANAGRSRATLDVNGRFAFRGVPAGEHAVSLGVRSSRRELARLERLVVLPGEDCTDPRLAEIDLRGLASAVTLRIVDSDGRRVPRGDVMIRDRSDASIRRGWFWNGLHRFLRIEESIDVLVHADGFRAAKVEDVRGDQSIVLEPGLEVRLILAERPALLDTSLLIEVSFRPVEGDADLLSWTCGPFDDRGEIRDTAPAPGRFAIEWRLQKVTDAGRSATSITPEPPLVIEVLDDAGEQRFEVALDREALAKAVEELKD